MFYGNKDIILAKPKEHTYLIKHSAFEKIAKSKTLETDMESIIKNAQEFNKKIRR